ncbi:hypothetical protein IV454_24600 [Massilia antarctica]|uniref:Uncharacterized protein n=2 Tax=Massilia antarctica TaxID=2765360 RepID=A0AA48WKS8_9BURK|nr:hypothetical protein IV454_24600 [Massilia antarctica]
MRENYEIRFIKPCRHRFEEHRDLTPQYARNVFASGRMVQINLDNCSIQRMERLPASPSRSDAEEVGLLPLVDLLTQAPVCLTAIGVNEMPENKVAFAKTAYENFCASFWPGHRDDVEATQRPYDPASTAKNVSFSKLNDGERLAYGCAYVSLLQMQNIARRYSQLLPEQRFECYLHSIVGMLDIVNAFELELAKYAFWSLNATEINQLPQSLQDRRRDIHQNFTKLWATTEKCRLAAFNGAMDIFWLNGANFADELGLTLDMGFKRVPLENWVGTTDHKLFRICKDIHSTFGEGSQLKHLAVSRHFLDDMTYWKNVDGIAHAILFYRRRAGYSGVDNLLERIDASVKYVEQELAEVLGQSLQ